MNILYIDTRNNKEIVVRLNSSNKEFQLKSIANKNRAQAALPLIEKVLKKAKLKVSDIEDIKVETGPGSFTGVRVGVAIANALGYGLNIKVNGKSIELPNY